MSATLPLGDEPCSTRYTDGNFRLSFRLNWRLYRDLTAKLLSLLVPLPRFERGTS
jgi:hypothetical protein